MYSVECILGAWRKVKVTMGKKVTGEVMFVLAVEDGECGEGHSIRESGGYHPV